MARLAGVNIPDEKRVEIALTYVHGIGRTMSVLVLDKAGIDINTRVKNLTESDLANIQTTINDLELPVEGIRSHALRCLIISEETIPVGTAITA